MNQSLISVIVPVFNSEKYLLKTIKSILDQTHSNFELILINDGSTDNSESICLDYSKNDERIKYHTQQNQGPSAARNVGLDLARGEYVTFVDADDYLVEDGLEILLMNSEGSDLVISGYINMFHNDKQSSTLPKISKHYMKSEFIEGIGQLLDQNLFHYVWDKLYRKDILETIRFDTTLKLGEDFFFNLEVLEKVKEISLVHEVTYKHIWINEDSLTEGFKEGLFLLRKKMYLSMVSFLEKNQVYTNENKYYVDQIFAKRIVACFMNLIAKDSPYDRKKIQDQIRLISEDEAVKKILPVFNQLPKWQLPYGYMIEKHMTAGIFAYSKLLLPVQNWRRSK